MGRNAIGTAALKAKPSRCRLEDKSIIYKLSQQQSVLHKELHWGKHAS